jgi:hypothetical protein
MPWQISASEMALKKSYSFSTSFSQRSAQTVDG